MRVATLLPSATDMVLALGHEDDLVGVSHSCDLPANVKPLRRLTATVVPSERSSETIDTFVRDHLNTNTALYELDIPALEKAAPDVIVSQGLCDVCAVATGDVEEAIASLPGKPTLVDLNPNNLDDIFTDLRRLGDVLGSTDRATELEASLRQRVAQVAEQSRRITGPSRPKVAFLEWLKPLFNAGHWNPELVELAGATEVLGRPGLPSQTTDIEQLVAADPDILMIACCGYRVPETLADLRAMDEIPEWRNLRAVSGGRVFVADGQDYFARPSPSVVDALERLAVTLHPTDFPSLLAAPFRKASNFTY
ncbi:MAG: cobalamin-binding protein [Pseudomonadota bacterium]